MDSTYSRLIGFFLPRNLFAGLLVMTLLFAGGCVHTNGTVTTNDDLVRPDGTLVPVPAENTNVFPWVYTNSTPKVKVRK